MKQLVEIEPNNKEIWFDMGETLAEIENYSKAYDINHNKIQRRKFRAVRLVICSIKKSLNITRNK